MQGPNDPVTPRKPRPRSALFTVLTAFGLLAPVVAIFWLINRYSVNMVWYDQWNDVQLLSHLYGGHITLASLWAEHNENRVFFPNLLVILLSYTTNLNVVVEDYLSGAMLVGATTLLSLSPPGFAVYAVDLLLPRSDRDADLHPGSKHIVGFSGCLLPCPLRPRCFVVPSGPADPDPARIPRSSCSGRHRQLFFIAGASHMACRAATGAPSSTQPTRNVRLGCCGSRDRNRVFRWFQCSCGRSGHFLFVQTSSGGTSSSSSSLLVMLSASRAHRPMRAPILSYCSESCFLDYPSGRSWIA